MPFDHDLNTLADLAVGQGEELPAVADRDALAALSAYGGPAQYPNYGYGGSPGDADRFAAVARAMTAHARSGSRRSCAGSRRPGADGISGGLGAGVETTVTTVSPPASPSRPAGSGGRSGSS